MTDRSLIVRSLRGSNDWPDGAKRVIIPLERITPQRRAILEALHPTIGHRFGTKKHIAKCIGMDWQNADQMTNLGKQLRNLRRNGYLYWPEQQGETLNANYKDGVHGLTPKGAEAVGLPLPPLNKQEYKHELGVSFIEMQLKFGALDAGIAWRMGQPARYRLADCDYVLDGHPMILHADFFLPGIEYERRKYNENPTDTDEKIDKALEYIDDEHHFREGFKKAMIPFIATTEARTRTLMDYVKRKRGDCTFLLFKTVPDWAVERKFPDPNGDMFTEPWLRVGHPPFSLQTL